MSQKLSKKNFLQRFFLGLGATFTLPEGLLSQLECLW